MDNKIRRLTKLAQQGDVEAAATLVAEKTRTGEVFPEHVEIAAGLGHPVAIFLIGPRPPMLPVWDFKKIQEIIDSFSTNALFYRYYLVELEKRIYEQDLPQTAKLFEKIKQNILNNTKIKADTYDELRREYYTHRMETAVFYCCLLAISNFYNNNIRTNLYYVQDMYELRKHDYFANTPLPYFLDEFLLMSDYMLGLR